MAPFALHQDTSSPFPQATQMLPRLAYFNPDFIFFFLFPFILARSHILFGSLNLHYLTYTPSVLRYQDSDSYIRDTSHYMCLFI